MPNRGRSTVNLLDYNNDKKELDAWKTSTDTRINDLFEHKVTVNDYESDKKNFEDLLTFKVTANDYSKDKKEYNSWKSSTDARIGELLKNKVSINDYKTSQEMVDNGIKSVRDDLQEFKDVAVPHLRNISGMSDSLKKLEGKTTELEAKISGYDGKFNTYDDKCERFRKEIKGGNEELGQRINGQGKILKEILAKINGGKGNKEHHTDPSNDSGDLSLVLYASNSHLSNNSPGGINLANYGTLIHAPHCPCRNDANINPYIVCTCRAFFKPSYGNLWAGLPQPIWPAPSWEPPTFERRTRRQSDSHHGSSNFNITPNIRLELVRDTGGGLFSKPKREAMSFDLGRAGGGGQNGRSRHRSQNNHLVVH